jgi:hypothetical protein
VVCNRTGDDSFRPPRLVPTGAAELVWNQTSDACLVNQTADACLPREAFR